MRRGDLSDETQAIQLALNVADWHTWYQGGPGFIVFVARNRQDGQELVSRAPARHAGDAVRWLAERCGVER